MEEIIYFLYWMQILTELQNHTQANFQNRKEQTSITVHSRQAIKKGLTHDKGTCTHKSQNVKEASKSAVYIFCTQRDG
uniref:Uncharacterized protein n=1 Tax=Setaria italica TaxID=4555 RepID=K3YXB5_SETIT